MDQIVNNLGEEAAKFVFLRRERVKLAKLEKVPEPKRTLNLELWGKEKEAILKGELEQVCKNIVTASAREIDPVFYETSLKEEVWKKSQNESAKLMRPYALLAAMPIIRKCIEDTVWGAGFDTWTHRTDGLNQNIASLESKLPTPFNTDKINKDPNYPAERVDKVDGKWVDVWLTKYLNSKRPIFFDPYDVWSQRMEEFYEKIYLVEWQKDQDLLRQPVAAKPLPPPSPPVSEQAQAIAGFFSEAEETGGTLRSRVSRIYRGGK